MSIYATKYLNCVILLRLCLIPPSNELVLIHILPRLKGSREVFEMQISETKEY